MFFLLLIFSIFSIKPQAKLINKTWLTATKMELGLMGGGRLGTLISNTEATERKAQMRRLFAGVTGSIANDNISTTLPLVFFIASSLKYTADQLRPEEQVFYGIGTKLELEDFDKYGKLRLSLGVSFHHFISADQEQKACLKTLPGIFGIASLEKEYNTFVCSGFVLVNFNLKPNLTVSKARRPGGAVVKHAQFGWYHFEMGINARLKIHAIFFDK